MTKDEYENQQRRLSADIEDARKALVLAQARFDDLCRDSRALRLDWQEQQRQRAIEWRQLHATATTRDGNPRRTGYVLEED